MYQYFGRLHNFSLARLLYDPFISFGCFELFFRTTNMSFQTQTQILFHSLLSTKGKFFKKHWMQRIEEIEDFLQTLWWSCKIDRNSNWLFAVMELPLKDAFDVNDTITY